MPALVVAMAGEPSSSRMRALATSQTFTSTRGAAAKCNVRNCSAFFICSAAGIGTSLTPVLHFVQEFGNTDHCPAHRAAPNFLRIVARRHAEGIEASIERFEHGLSLDLRTHAAGSAV